MAQKFMTTRQAAERAGISAQTLYTWMKLGFAAPEPVIDNPRHSVRLWTEADVQKLINLRKLINRENKGGRPRKEGTHATTRK